MNLVPSLVLRSPLHRLMSGKYVIIEFTGRSSGRRYATPVAYVQEGSRVLLTTDSRWWRNLRGGAPVRLRLRGRTVEGTAQPVEDPARARAVLRALVDAIPSYAGPAGLRTEGGRVPDAEVDRAVQEGRVAIEVSLRGDA
jgi:deazaflavin-dependent oxidoreductase (nitroreductase family)